MRPASPHLYDRRHHSARSSETISDTPSCAMHPITDTQPYQLRYSNTIVGHCSWTRQRIKHSSLALPQARLLATIKLTYDAVFLETEVIHRLINSFLYLLPITAALDKLVYVLRIRQSSVAWVEGRHPRGAHLRSERPSVPRNIPDNLRKVFGILNNENMAQHLEVGKVCGNLGHF